MLRPARTAASDQGRAGSDLASHHAADWRKVEAFYEHTAQDPLEIDGPSIDIDTAALEQSMTRVIDWLGSEASIASTGAGVLRCRMIS